MFVVVDGIDGSGKTTLIKSLKKRIEDYIGLGQEVVIVSEVNDSAFAKQYKEIISDPRSTNAIRLKLMEAMREEQSVVVKAALDRGDFVIQDRYLPVTLVYQIIVGKLMEEPFIESLAEEYTQLVENVNFEAQGEFLGRVKAMISDRLGSVEEYLGTAYSTTKVGGLRNIGYVPNALVQMTTGFTTCWNRVKREDSNGLFESRAFEMFLRYHAYQYVFSILSSVYSYIGKSEPMMIGIDGGKETPPEILSAIIKSPTFWTLNPIRE